MLGLPMDVREHGHVGNDDAGLGEEPKLQPELERTAQLVEHRPGLEELGDDDGDEIRLPAR